MVNKAKTAQASATPSVAEKPMVYINPMDEQKIECVENGTIIVEDIVDVTWKEYVEQGLKAHAFTIYGVELHSSMLMDDKLPVILATKFDSSRRTQGEEKLSVWYRINFNKDYVVRRLALIFGEVGIFQNNTDDELNVCTQLLGEAQTDYFNYVRNKSLMDARSLAIQAAAKLNMTLDDYLQLITSPTV